MNFDPTDSLHLLATQSKQIRSQFPKVLETFIANQQELNDRFKIWECIKIYDEKCELTHCNGPLYGSFVGVKDNIATFDFPTKMGTEYWRGTPGGFDARVIHNIRMAGATIVGKTKCSEFAVHARTGTVNPRYTDCEPGTSSSGSAAAVASGSVSLTLATQTAGSIAKPASYCGVIGYKPTFGDLPRTGVLKTTEHFDTVGFIGRRVTDIRTIYRVARVSGPNHPFHEKQRVLQNSSRFKNLLIFSSPKLDDARDDMRLLLEAFALGIARKLNLRVSLFEDQDFSSIRNAFWSMYYRDLSYFLSDHISGELISDELSALMNAGLSVSRNEYQAYHSEVKEWRKKMQNASHNSLILSFATSNSAPAKNSDDLIDANFAITSSGLPQITFPAFRDENGKLINISIASPRFSDENLLDLAGVAFPGDALEVPSFGEKNTLLNNPLI